MITTMYKEVKLFTILSQRAVEFTAVIRITDVNLCISQFRWKKIVFSKANICCASASVFCNTRSLLTLKDCVCKHKANTNIV